MFRLIFCFAILAFSSHYEQEPCKEQLDLAYINRNDLIVVAQLNEEYSNDYANVFTIKKVFKGEVYEFVPVESHPKFDFEPGKDYLIYAIQLDKKKSHIYTLTECSRTSVLTNVPEDISFLIDKIKCPDEPDTRSGGCLRNIDPVCGCDNKTYGSPCEARIRGVKVYSPGRCKD